MNKPPVYAIDFESYYDKHINVEELGLNKYVQTADIYLVAIVGPGVRYVGHPKDAPWDELDGDWVSHNAGFDRACFRSVMRQRYPMRTSVAYESTSWHCTSSMSVYLRCGRSLKSAAKNLLGKDAAKDVRKAMKGCTVEQMKMLRDDMETMFARSLYDDVCAYALHDAELCWELWDKFGDQFPPFERWLANHTYEICAKGVPIDVLGAEAAKSKLELIIFEAKKLLPWCTGGEDDVALSPKALKNQCLLSRIAAPVSLAADSEDCEKWLSQYAEQYPWVGAMRQIRRGNMMLKKIETILSRTNLGRFNMGLRYFGSHTGRWSGESGFNMQNMNKEPFEGIDLRKLFIAEPGMKLVIFDCCQVEARILRFLAGDYKTLNMIRDGMSIYEVHARRYLNYHGEDELKKVNKKLYSLSKARELALGFQCGAEKFQAMARLPMYGNLELTLDECKFAVADYRAKNACVTHLWRQLDSDMKLCVGSDYDILLPSGRKLTYFDVHYRKGKKFKNELCAAKEKGSKLYDNFYGGKLTENCVQATARDIFAHSFMQVQTAGYEVLWTSHDEAIVHVPVNVPKEEIEKAATSSLPDWASEFPLGIESLETSWYTK
jgi:hypothetical protein